MSNERPLASIGLGGAHRLQTFLGGQLAGVAMVTAIVAGIWIAGGFDMLALGGALGSLGAIGSIAVLLACFAVQSGIEEFFFRGWMLSAIAAKFGVVIAVVLSSLVFTFLHFDPRGSWIFVANVFLFAAFACCVPATSGYHGLARHMELASCRRVRPASHSSRRARAGSARSTHSCRPRLSNRRDRGS